MGRTNNSNETELSLLCEGFDLAQLKSEVIQYFGSPQGRADIKKLGYKARAEFFRRLLDVLCRTSSDEVTQLPTRSKMTEESRQALIAHLRHTGTES